MQNLWDACLRRLEQELPAQQFNTWIRPLAPEAGEAADTLILAAPNRFVLELVRGRRLKERYALLWLATGVVLLVLSAWRGGLNTIAGWVGVTSYPPAVLFAVATLFILLVLLHYSTVISRLSDQSTVLAQRLALLEQQREATRDPAKGSPGPAG